MEIRKIICWCSLLVLELGIYSRAPAQQIDPNDLSTVQVDQLTDDQIRAFVSRAETSGLSESQMEQMALSRGMPVSEISKLRARVEKLGLSPEQATTGQDIRHKAPPFNKRKLSDSLPAQNDDLRNKTDSVKRGVQLPVFGANLFNNAQPVFEPNLRIASPSNYIIGPEDQLLIDIYGNSEASYQLTVSPEGTINIPYAGIVSVSGVSMENATARIRKKLSAIYTGLSSGATKVGVSLGNIRSIRVTVTGEVKKPGTFTLPSLATAFNALYASGGPDSSGSYRDIRVIRNGQAIAILDIYQFLMDGAFRNNIGLQDQDVLLIPPYSQRVTLAGEVKHPAIFELQNGENFEDLLRYAGGFTETAYQARIKVIKNTGTEHRIEDLLQSQFAQYKPQTGDHYTVDRILSRFVNRVQIAGAVYRPGIYELSPGLTLSMLIKKASGVTEDAFLNRATILRLKPDLQTEQLSFNVAALLAGTAADIPLKREDRVSISSIFDLRDQYTVRIDGEVRKPGILPFAEGMTVEELILQAGGFRESASPKRIEISRRNRNADTLSNTVNIAEVFQVAADQALAEQAASFVLNPYDVVVVRTTPGYESQKTVRIEGEVRYPGLYAIIRKDERISDLVKRAGGFTPYAYPDGASLRRGAEAEQPMSASSKEQQQKALEKEKELEREQAMRSLQQDVNSVNEEVLARSLYNNRVGIHLTRIMDKPGSGEDLILEGGDQIRIPKELQTVKISGEVLSPVTVVYSPSKGFKQYISESGGFTQRALKKRSYVIYANGIAKSTSRFLFFNHYPQLRPGAEIFVPQKQVKERLNASQWIGIGTGLASMAAIIVSLINRN
ncbi:protein involved in polysaccharide export, contains SLBB domain of the beta-grasp fold [bacterium A37T11]|nr:protein involved in polysaccharide export, contains SLBB domain of the beta-grasp fold [bacterium A37T11]